MGIRIFLTGHIHEEVAERISVDGKDLLSIGAGSASVVASNAPDREPLHYNLINIQPSNAIENKPDMVTIYSRLFYKNKFVNHHTHAKLLYRWDDISGWVLEKTN